MNVENADGHGGNNDDVNMSLGKKIPFRRIFLPLSLLLLMLPALQLVAAAVTNALIFIRQEVGLVPA